MKKQGDLSGDGCSGGPLSRQNEFLGFTFFCVLDNNIWPAKRNMEQYRELSEGGVFSDVPAMHDPVSRFFVQTVFIIAMCRGLSMFSHYVRQPAVFFEIIGGIIMGPSAFGKIHGFTDTMFPESSLENLKIVANIGLVLYLFLVGLEMDPKLLQTHARNAGGIALVGMAVPFALGIAISRTLYDVLQGSDDGFEHVSFTSFFVFVGTAMSVTAFPVLARMLKEGGLIYTRPGALAMGAAALNDAIAWCLLVLAISIANSKHLSTAGFVFLSLCAFGVGIVVVVRPIFERIVYDIESRHSTQLNGHLFALTLCLLFLCAWVTALLGVHAIFGAFIFGLIVPRGTHLFRQCTSCIEELVLTFTLPLYFALSGLETDITLISTRSEGAMVVLVCVVASLGKFIGAGGAALIGGMPLKESAVVAVLMNTRGLVELIALNLGLRSRILSRRTFTVLVLMCLFTTCITSPLIEYIYPVHSRVRTGLGEEDRNSSLDSDDRRDDHLNASGDKREEGEDKQQDGSDVNRITGGVNSSSGDKSVTVVDIAHMHKECRIGVVIDSLDQLQGVTELLSGFAAHNADSELSVCMMRFVEPTHTTRDEFLALNENGRLVRVEEETTDLGTALRYIEDYRTSSLPRTPELLPLSMFCRGLGCTSLRAYRIQGDPDEFPFELRRLSRNSDCHVTVVTWRPDSHYAQKLFWSAVHISASPIMLMIHKDPHDSTGSASDNLETRERSRTNSVFSNNGFSPHAIQRGRAGSLFGRGSLAYLFDTDDLETPPDLASSSFASHVQLYSNVPSRSHRAGVGRSSGAAITVRTGDLDKQPLNVEIVAIITGQPMDSPILAMLLRFAESNKNSITVHIPRDYVHFDLSLQKSIAYFRTQVEGDEVEGQSVKLTNIHINWLEVVLSTDLESICRIACETPFDYCYSSFIEPCTTNINAAMEALADQMNHKEHGYSRIPHVTSSAQLSVEYRVQMGMPGKYAHSTLTHPELGELGSKLLAASSPKACQIMILHESHKMHYTRRSSLVPAATTSAGSNSNHGHNNTGIGSSSSSSGVNNTRNGLQINTTNTVSSNDTTTIPIKSTTTSSPRNTSGTGMMTADGTSNRSSCDVVTRVTINDIGLDDDM